jgi:hypothetical protein
MDGEGGGVKCDGGTIQSCYIPSQWVTESLFFSMLVQHSQKTGTLQGVVCVLQVYNCGLSMSPCSHAHVCCCVWIHTCDHTCEHVHSHLPTNSLSLDNEKKTLSSTPSCNTWSPGDWKHSAGSALPLRHDTTHSWVGCVMPKWQKRVREPLFKVQASRLSGI